MNDKTITLYNAYRKDKEICWNRTAVRGCEYRYSSARTTGQNGTVVFTPLLTVVIPVTADTQGRKYIDSYEYAKLSPEDIVNYFNDVFDCLKKNEETYKMLLSSNECVFFLEKLKKMSSQKLLYTLKTL